MIRTQFRVVQLHRRGPIFSFQKRRVVFGIPVTSWLFCKATGENYSIKDIADRQLQTLNSENAAIDHIKSLCKLPVITKEIFRTP